VSRTDSPSTIHLVFCTKECRKTIAKERQAGLWARIAEVCQENQIQALAVGGLDDHVHVLMEFRPPMTPAQATLLIKSYSAKWIGNGFEWQRGYIAFSVSRSDIPALVRYIEKQELFHQKTHFLMEFVMLLRKHGVILGSKALID
jgi:REP element-mobilizing transposase RayT